MTLDDAVKAIQGTASTKVADALRSEWEHENPATEAFLRYWRDRHTKQVFLQPSDDDDLTKMIVKTITGIVANPTTGKLYTGDRAAILARAILDKLRAEGVIR